MFSGRVEKIIEGDMWMSWFVFSLRIWIGKWGWMLIVGLWECVVFGMYICFVVLILYFDWLFICIL